MRIVKKCAALIAFLLISVQVCFSQSQKKQDIKVLYVGFDPSIPLPDKLENSTGINGGGAPERFIKEYETRMPAFKNYLESYFTTVKTIDARNYEMQMSAEYDVTIFDEVIKPWKERVHERKDGRTIYEPAKYLTEDFDRAAIFIGHTAPTMGESVGSKLDWHCLCLDADAHTIQTDHPIFNRPFKVSLTYEKKEIPKSYFLYASGRELDEKIPMWRVQKEGYREGNGYRVGLVSRRDGFEDSPDTEFIASGVNTKDAGAVAIGRHGNFFLWGFSGSPNYMTDEAKQVFANAIVYMKGFNGQKLVARKYTPTIAVRDNVVEEMLYRTTKEAFRHYLKYEEDINNAMANEIAKLQKKKEQGDSLTELEKAILKNNTATMEPSTWPKYFQSVTRMFFKEEYLENPDALKTFLEQNREYMYSPPDAQYSLNIDEEAKALGISNRDIRLMYKAVEFLQEEKQTEIAQRLLQRYTTEEFETAKEWKQWLDTNRKYLFFTDAGGYVWVINTKAKSGDVAKD